MDGRHTAEWLFHSVPTKALISTARLAWGASPAAQTVIIKGADSFNQELAKWDNLSHLNVLRMFGHTGRQAADNNGGVLLITEFCELPD
jgi:replicative superfamily II helicase